MWFIARLHEAALLLAVLMAVIVVLLILLVIVVVVVVLRVLSVLSVVVSSGVCLIVVFTDGQGVSGFRAWTGAVAQRGQMRRRA